MSGGGLNYTDIFFSSRLYSFVFVCFCFVLEHSPFFSLSTGSQLIGISIEDTGNPPPPGLLIIFSGGGGGGGGLPVFPILIMCKLGTSR